SWGSYRDSRTKKGSTSLRKLLGISYTRMSWWLCWERVSGGMRNCSERWLAIFPGGRRNHRLRRSNGTPGRGWRGYFPDALEIRALRIEPDLQFALRYRTGSASNRWSG